MPEREAMNRERDLLPCPFCGETDGVVLVTMGPGYPQFVTLYLVHCNRCAAETQRDPSRDKAITAWNTRSDTTLRASEARAEETEKAHEADTVAAAELIDLLHTRVATAEADAKALRQRLWEIREIAAAPRPSYDMERCLKSIAALAAIQDGEKKESIVFVASDLDVLLAQHFPKDGEGK